MSDQKANLGEFLKEIRSRNQWTLSQVSALTGLAVSTLSKVENNQMSLTYDRLIQLAQGLGVDIAELFGAQPSTVAGLGRRTITKAGEGRLIRTQNYDYRYLCTEISQKSMAPIFAIVQARTIEQFGELIRHGGEEYFYVLEGEVAFYTEHYASVHLTKGDSGYFDASMGHAYLSLSAQPAQILCICSTPEKELVASALGAQSAPSGAD